MYRRWPDAHYRKTNRFRGCETLEARRVLDCQGYDLIEICVPGDSNLDGQFNEQDLVDVLEAGKYRSGTPALWIHGDWNRDNRFNEQDLVTALQAGTYLRGVLSEDLTSLIAASTIDSLALLWGPPITISNAEQLLAALPYNPSAVVDRIRQEVDFERQSLLLFAGLSRDGQRLEGEVTQIDGAVHIDFQFSDDGLMADYMQQRRLFAIPNEATWNIDMALDGVEDSAVYTFNRDRSRLVVRDGVAGSLIDEYNIEGSLTLHRYADGSASIAQVDATLRGREQSSLDGTRLDATLNLSGLTGLQTGDSWVAFSGLNRTVAGIVRITVGLGNGRMALHGRREFSRYSIESTLQTEDTFG